MHLSTAQNVSFIEKKLADKPFLLALTESILSSSQPSEIWSTVSEMMGRTFCDVDTHHQITCFHFEVSQGATFGLLVADQKVMLKIYNPDSCLEDLKAQSRFQAWLAGQGFPCPAVVAPIDEYNGLAFGVEAFSDRGRRADASQSTDRRLMAQCLMELLTIAQAYPYSSDLPRQTLQTVIGSPWPKPHNALFNFETTKDDAQWIDAVGLKYHTIIKSMQNVRIGHCDWGAKHCLIEDGAVCMTYDWDSVCLESTEKIIGSASVNFMANWYIEGPNRPSLEQSMAFITDCLSCHSVEVSASTMAACMLYSAGYGARCEHAIRNEHNLTENRDYLKALLTVDLVSEIEIAIQNSAGTQPT